MAWVPLPVVTIKFRQLLFKYSLNISRYKSRRSYLVWTGWDTCSVGQSASYSNVKITPMLSLCAIEWASEKSQRYHRKGGTQQRDDCITQSVNIENHPDDDSSIPDPAFPRPHEKTRGCSLGPWRSHSCGPPSVLTVSLFSLHCPSLYYK